MLEKTKLKCACGGEYSSIPDEETSGWPTSLLARQFHCNVCQSDDWLEPFYFGLEDWASTDSK